MSWWRRFRTIGWHWSRPGRWYVSICPSEINVPRLSVDRRERWVCLSWGSAISDPVWSIEIHWGQRAESEDR